MRNASSTYQTLTEKLPGLRRCLERLLQDFGAAPELSDEQLRTRYFCIKGARKINDQNGSVVVREHIKFFFEHMFGHLLAYYGEKTSENVMISTAYGEAVRLVLSRIL